jgi:peroxiredoxin
MYKKMTAAIGIALASTVALLATSNIPRPAKELTIAEPSGKQALVSQYRGDVVLVQFLFTTCQHCAATARTFTKLQEELGPRGLHVVGVAFNEEAQSGRTAVRQFIADNQVGFPIGVAARDTVLSYLGLSVMSRLAVPQVVVIDRKGVIRARSEPLGSPGLQDESRLRPLLEQLLKQ